MANQNLNALAILELFEEGEEAVDEIIGNVFADLVEEENEPRNPRRWVKIDVDVEGWRRLQDPSFKIHFRMSRATFDELVNDVGRHLVATNRLQRERTPLDLILMMSLWILFTGDTFRSTAIKFKVTPGVVFYHYDYIIEVIREMGPQFITWPNAEERAAIKAKFFRRSGYPGVVGCIDGMHTNITAPLVDSRDYINRHHTYSIATQAVVDCDLLVRDLYIGQPGSVHDSRIFRLSSLGTHLLNDPDMLSPDEHLLGDGAYTLTDKVIVPYADNGLLTACQRYHNRVLSTCRSAVERGFGVCKSKCRRLKLFYNRSVQRAVDHIAACFILHNYIILHGERVPRNQHVADAPPPNLCQMI